MSEFNDRFAVVTGASSGIGLKLTETLLGHGATVLAMARREGPPESLHAHSGKRLHWLAGDVTRERDLDALASRAASIGPVDYLVPNAGIAQLADGLDSLAFEQQWRVNGAGALNTFSVLSRQTSKPASVVFIGTFLSQVTFPGLAAYIASKAALIAQARTLAVEWAEKGVRINLVSPGPTATPIWASLGLSDAQAESVTRSINQRLVDGSFLSPGEIVDVVMFLLSSKSAGLYGQGVDRRQGLRAALRAADAGRRIATSGAFAVSCRDPTAAQLGAWMPPARRGYRRIRRVWRLDSGRRLGGLYIVFSRYHLAS